MNMPRSYEVPTFFHDFIVFFQPDQLNSKFLVGEWGKQTVTLPNDKTFNSHKGKRVT